MAFTQFQLKQIAPTASNISLLLPLINSAMDKYSIDKKLRQSHFIAQILHESGALRYTEEIASGEAYENRLDLGNRVKGDGKKFKGRGLIQLTGRANYAAYGKYLGVDLESNPVLVATDYVADVAGWFWKKRNLNYYADFDDLKAVTKRINGGYNGLQDRQQYLNKAKSVLMI